MSRQRQAYEYIVPMAMNLDKFKLMYNKVIVEYDSKQTEKTPSGLYAPIGALNHETAANFVPRIGKVFKLPKMLYYDKKDMANSMRWKTEIELEIGDTVWMNHVTALDFQFQFEGKNYKLINYEDIVCAKRNGKVIMINGYILCKPVFEKKKVLMFEKEEEILTHAVVEYIGKHIEQYQDPRRYETDSIKVGDRIIFDKKALGKKRDLESDYFRVLDGKHHIVAQRYMIVGILV